jgi:hypothetical protein
VPFAKQFEIVKKITLFQTFEMCTKKIAKPFFFRAYPLPCCGATPIGDLPWRCSD